MTVDFKRAAAFVAFHEGYVSTARWDVNHYRLGFGSDTEGPEQKNVVKGMTTTYARALQNLAARLPKFEETIIQQVGAQRWSALGENTQIALLDFGYNYGDLTSTLAQAIAVGQPLSSIVRDVEAREGDNEGVNKLRRHDEAALIATDEALT